MTFERVLDTDWEGRGRKCTSGGYDWESVAGVSMTRT